MSTGSATEKLVRYGYLDSSGFIDGKSLSAHRQKMLAANANFLIDKPQPVLNLHWKLYNTGAYERNSGFIATEAVQVTPYMPVQKPAGHSTLMISLRGLFSSSAESSWRAQLATQTEPFHPISGKLFNGDTVSQTVRWNTTCRGQQGEKIALWLYCSLDLGGFAQMDAAYGASVGTVSSQSFPLNTNPIIVSTGAPGWVDGLEEVGHMIVFTNADGSQVDVPRVILEVFDSARIMIDGGPILGSIIGKTWTIYRCPSYEIYGLDVYSSGSIT